MSAMENLDLDAMVADLRDGFGDEPESRLGEDADMDQLIRDYQTRMMEARQKKMEEQAQANLEEGQAFLEENADKDGTEVTDSGLQYQVLESGEEGAESPTLEDTVEVHYKGMLRDGTVFDSSIERDKPAVFGLKHIIPGWQEALPMMKVGDKWKLFLPPELGYGEQGAGGDCRPQRGADLRSRAAGRERRARRTSRPRKAPTRLNNPRWPTRQKATLTQGAWLFCAGRRRRASSHKVGLKLRTRARSAVSRLCTLSIN